MSSFAPIAVLKFGSSVLSHVGQIRAAVEEIYRHRRLGYQVIAVVSAIGEATDSLIQEARTIAPEPDAGSLALLLSTGETRSVGLLTMACCDSGIAAFPLLGHELGLVTTSNFLDAEPESLGASRIREFFLEYDVLVIPGFIGRDQFLRPTLLGRGGSDLTAIFVAAQVEALTCILLKDTDGVFESDPSCPGHNPRQYRFLSFEDALTIDGDVLQEKAVRWAADLGQVFEVRQVGGGKGTHVGARKTVLFAPPERLSPKSVVLLGCGQVGKAVLLRLLASPERFRVQRVAVRNLKKRRGDDVPQNLLTTDTLGSVSESTDLVIELMGDVPKARHFVKTALRNGSHVVTANKELMAQYGDELKEVARRHRRRLFFSASVGGAVPIIEIVASRRRNRSVVGIDGVLNGTSNFVLDQMHEGASQEEAVRLAQRSGFCEVNPQDDLKGEDAARKLVVMSREIWGRRPLTQVEDQIDQETRARCLKAKDAGERLRQVASVSLRGSQPIATVRLKEVSSESFLGQCKGAENRVVIVYETGEVEKLRGQGAGPNPTAEAVLGDALQILREQRDELCEGIDQEVGP